MKDKDSSKSAGGLARALALSPEQRKVIAMKAAAKRWPKQLQATHKGNFKEDFGIDVDCYVLNDEAKTAVISQRRMGTAIGLQDTSGKAFTRFVAGKAISQFIGGELQEKFENPLKFQLASAGGEQPPSEVNGYDVTLLIDVCKAIIRAESEQKLLASQAHIAKQAHIILGASAKAGIKGLVYALSGYDATREEVVAAFKLYVRNEAREYEKEFPAQLYEEWYRLYEIPKPERNKPWKFMHLTIDHVYRPLASSQGKVLDLTRQKREDSGEKNSRLHQFLSEVGVKALRTQLGQLLGIARVSKDKDEYELFVDKLFGKQPDLFK